MARLVQTKEEKELLRRENRSLRVENTLLKEGLGSGEEPRYGEIVGESGVMMDVFPLDRPRGSEASPRS